MNCPKCGTRTYVSDVVATPENEKYRRRICKACGHFFYTVEFETEFNDEIHDIWVKYRRGVKK